MKRNRNNLMIALAAICCVALNANRTDAAEEKAAFAPPPPQARIQIGRPVAKKWPANYKRPQQIQVQTNSKYKNRESGKASTPADERGLQVTIQPEKKSFNMKEALAFTVTLKNVSKKTIMLHGGELLGLSPKLVVANMKSAAQWTVQGDFTDNKGVKSISLKPGEEIQRTLVASVNTHQIPGQVMPFPQPVRPVLKGKPVKINIKNIKKAAPAPKRAKPLKPAKRVRRVRPVVKPVQQQGGGNNGVGAIAPARVFAVKVVQEKVVKDKKAKKAAVKEVAKVKVLAKRAAAAPVVIRCGVGIAMPFNQTLNLPCGKGECRARLFLEFKKDPSKVKHAAPHWTGKIVSQPVDFEVAEYAIIIDRRGK